MTISTDRKPSSPQLKKLFDQESWSKDRSLASIEALLASLTNFVAAYDGDELIGFGRAISDGHYRALIDDVIVDARYQGQGIGIKLMEALESQLSDIDEVFLNTSDGLEKFYGPFGYKKFDGLTMFKQRNA